MFLFFTLYPQVDGSEDTRLLNFYLQMLCGLPCIKAEMVYGDELFIHFGEPSAYCHPKLYDEVKGEFVLGTRASRWELTSPESERVVTPEMADAGQVKAEFDKLSGTRVVEVYTGSVPMPIQGVAEIALQVRFSNGTHLFVTPTPDFSGTGVSDFELFAPFGMCLSCGLGRKWSFGTSAN